MLVDAKADLLVYGNGERAVVAIAHRLAAGEPITQLTDIRGTAFLRKGVPPDWTEIDSTSLDRPGPKFAATDPYAARPPCDPRPEARVLRPDQRAATVIRLPSFEAVRDDRVLYAHASRILHLETNPGNARALVQRHGDREVWVNPPPIPLSTQELDGVYDLPYSRRPHTSYGDRKIPAFEMIQHSVTIMRGCFGGCTFVPSPSTRAASSKAAPRTPSCGRSKPSETARRPSPDTSPI